jgi:hypothetical protein
MNPLLENLGSVEWYPDATLPMGYPVSGEGTGEGDSPPPRKGKMKIWREFYHIT